MLKILLYTLKKVKDGGMTFRTSNYQLGWLFGERATMPGSP